MHCRVAGRSGHHHEQRHGSSDNSFSWHSCELVGRRGRLDDAVRAVNDAVDIQQGNGYSGNHADHRAGRRPARRVRADQAESRPETAAIHRAQLRRRRLAREVAVLEEHPGPGAIPLHRLSVRHLHAVHGNQEKYDGPGDGPHHGPGQASISFSEPADLPVEIADLNDAVKRGDEIGSHFNGHFCQDNPPGADQWNTGDWNNELDQFFALIKNVDVNNGITAKLNLPAAEIKGERTPCLEGTQDGLYPALQAHGMTYDTSFTRNGLYWPTQTTKYMTGGYKIWQLGMSQFPIEEPVLDYPSHHKQITMDFNYYYSQRHSSSVGISADQSAKDSAQVLATYNTMFDAVHSGNRAPMILGNHFEAWNNNAYTKALGSFVLAKCGQPDVKCLPFRDLIAWMNAQDPAVLAQLQAQSPEFGNPSN